MTTPDLPADRPLPDASDLRLLGELVNNVSIPLPNVAWNAQMSQAEAAARLVSMAERGMPLRLVAEGDRHALWQVLQAGPVSPSPAVPPVTAAPVADVPAAEVHQVAEPAPVAAAPGIDAAAAEALETVAPEAQAQPAPEPPAEIPATETPVTDPAAESAAEAAPGVPIFAAQTVTGPTGEYLSVAIVQVLDPATDTLRAGGLDIVAPGQRAVLVRSAVTNHAPVPYQAPGDLYLVLESDQGTLLGRTAAAPAGYPVFSDWIAPGATADGWSTFIIDAQVRLAGLKWCLRPDLPASIVSWPIGG